MLELCGRRGEPRRRAGSVSAMAGIAFTFDRDSGARLTGSGGPRRGRRARPGRGRREAARDATYVFQTEELVGEASMEVSVKVLFWRKTVSSRSCTSSPGATGSGRSRRPVPGWRCPASWTRCARELAGRPSPALGHLLRRVRLIPTHPTTARPRRTTVPTELTRSGPCSPPATSTRRGPGQAVAGRLAAAGHQRQHPGRRRRAPDWPAQVRVFTSVNVLVDGAASPVAATVVSPPPRSDLWKRLFRADSPVQLDDGGEVGDIAGAGTSVLHGPLTRALRAIYARPATNGAAAAPGTDPLRTALSAGAVVVRRRRPGGSRTGRGAGAGRGGARGGLRPARPHRRHHRDARPRRGAPADQGLHAAADVVPLVTVLQRLRGAPATGPQARAGRLRVG